MIMMKVEDVGMEFETILRISCRKEIMKSLGFDKTRYKVFKIPIN